MREMPAPTAEDMERDIAKEYAKAESHPIDFSSRTLAFIRRAHAAEKRVRELEAELIRVRNAIPLVGPCGMPNHAHDCDCEGMGGAR